MVLLGRNGIINQALQSAGLIDVPLPLLYNKLGILIGMTYVLLPYMILRSMRRCAGSIPSLTRAAHGLGASRLYAFWRIYLPLSLHGVISGSLIVFILAIGFFITPALMGGPGGRDDRHADRARRSRSRWTGPTAAIMSLVLLAVTLVLYGIYYRVTDVRRMMGA